MAYRISDSDAMAQQSEYKKNYGPFVPYKVSSKEATHFATIYSYLVSTQNGQDTDDYGVGDNNKVEAYLKDFPEGSKVLLLGVGTGRETLVAKSLGLDAVGVTLGSRNVDYGTKYLGLEGSNHRECLCEALPFSKETFDVVAGFQVFEHALAPLLFLLEQGRVLKYGGKLMLEWPPADKFNMGDNPHHQVCFTPGQAKALFEKAGFSDIKLSYEDKSTISEEDMWRGDQVKMLYIEGLKRPCQKDYVLKAWAL
jgi:SAM-dependent methyltransferase